MKVFPTSIECPITPDLRGSRLEEELGERLTDETCADSGFVGKDPAHNLPLGDLAKRAVGVSRMGGMMEPGHVSKVD